MSFEGLTRLLRAGRKVSNFKADVCQDNETVTKQDNR